MTNAVKILVVFLLTASLLCGCAFLPSDQTVTCGELTITIPDSFMDWSQDSASQGVAFNYAASEVGICGIYEEKTVLQSFIPDMDARRYAELFIETNGLLSAVDTVDGIPCFTYVAEGNPSIQYLCGTFESDNNFWVVQAYCEPEDFDSNRASMWEYITSVTME